MKYADGYTRLGWSIASLVLLAAFVFLLGRALQVLEIGVAYTVWTGIGAVGTLTMGALLFGEALSPMKFRHRACADRDRGAEVRAGVSGCFRRSPDGA